LSVGDAIVIGPFPADSDDNESPPNISEARSSPNSYNTPLSHPSATELSRIASRNALSASVTKGEWHNAHIMSIRNLRLPVHTLGPGQIGTIGIVFDLPEEELSNGPFERRVQTTPRIRKGMVTAIPNRSMRETGMCILGVSLP